MEKCGRRLADEDECESGRKCYGGLPRHILSKNTVITKVTTVKVVTKSRSHEGKVEGKFWAQKRFLIFQFVIKRRQEYASRGQLILAHR
jgi:hypothetical protein